MKKVSFLAAVLGTALLLTGCKQTTDDTGSITAISINPATYTFTYGDDALRLSCTATPAGIEPDVTWSSSNEEVATVDDNGVVTPLNIGEANITATLKTNTEIKSVCNIKVVELKDNISFYEAYVGISDYDSVNTVVYEHNKMGTLNVHVCTGRVQLFTEGLYFNASGKLDGAQRGGWIYISAPMALAYADENEDNPNMSAYSNGVMFSLGDYYIDLEPSDTTEIKWHHATKGYTDDEIFIGYLQEWLDDFNTVRQWTDSNYTSFICAGYYGVGGTSLNLYQYKIDEETQEGSYQPYQGWLWKYIPDGIVTSGTVSIGSEEGSSKYMNKIESMNLNVKFLATDSIGIPGAYMSYNYADTTYTLLSTGVEFSDEKNYVIASDSTASAAGLEIFIDHIPARVSDNQFDGKPVALPKDKLSKTTIK